MPSSPTHNIVRSLQLAVSISLVATAAFLLHYRTRSHSNFTDEPLASCISGAVAFIYALWAILNHRRQPDNHRWIYLHGLCCLVVCGLLIAGATLAFIYTKQGILCERFHDARDSISAGGGKDDTSGDGSWNGSSVSLGHFMGSMIAKRDLPEYEDGKQYPPGALCENTYEDMDRACGVMGVVGALLWLMDFCLIFGFCGSSGRYGPHRHPRRRPGQVLPDDAEGCYPAGQRSEDNILQEDYYDTLNQRSREPHWLDHERTKDDPRQHVQGPIPFSMQQKNFGGAMPLTPRPFTTPERPPLALNHDSSDITRQYDTRPMAVNVQPLSPPPLPRTKWEQPPDSPTQPSHTNQEPQQPQNTSILTVSSPSEPLALPPVIITGPLTPPFMTTVQQAEEPQQESPIPGEYTMSESQGCLSSRASSPWSPGSACYVYNPSQREYFPSYVNMAARVEQQQQQVKQSQGRSSAGSGASATPVLRVSAPSSPAPQNQGGTADSQRVL